MNNYNVIYHEDRIQLGLSVIEYCICDTIYHLSNNPKYNWCIMSRENMAKFFDVSKRGVLNTIEKLVSLGLIEKDENTKYLKTTQLWYETIILKNGGAKIAPSVQNGTENEPKSGAKNALTGEKIAPNIYINNILNNYIFINSEVKEIFTKYLLDRIEKKEKITESTIEFAYNSLNKKGKTAEEQIEICENSIANGRKGLFPVQKGYSTAKKPTNGVYEVKEYGLEGVEAGKILDSDQL